MKILICNERFLFRFGVDRVLLMLGRFWKLDGHEIIMMGNRLDPKAVDNCSDDFIRIPEAPDYLHANEYTLEYFFENWDTWFDDKNTPDVALVAGWPFYKTIGFLREKCGNVIFHDYGAVPTEGMSESQIITQKELRRLRKENLRLSNRVVAISSFLEETQSKKDVEGAVPTSYVHLGIDHLDMQLWIKDELRTTQDSVIEKIIEYKAEGFKLIFQPGRWENDNYKNSAASIEIIRKLNSENIKHKVLVLSSMEDMGDIPLDVKDNYYCLGFVDDETMRIAMELSDAGFSPTLWEGFDLPLGEMQYLNKYMFVLDIGAHPEVVSNPYFLCKDIEEVANKLVMALKGEVPFDTAQFLSYCETFRKTFTWRNCADKMMDELRKTILDSTTVFVDVTNACHDTANSGVMRVTRKITHYLQCRVNLVFVLWDESIDKYVFPYDEEIKLLCAYGGPNKSLITYKSVEGETRTRLDDVFESITGTRKIHLFTETVNHAIMAKVIPYFHTKKVAVAAIFYDAIAVLRPELCSKTVSENHEKYMIELSACDLVLPIADHNQLDLENYWQKENIDGTKIITVSLAAEMDNVPRNLQKLTSINNEQTNILFVSTLEPRKNHIRFLKGFELLLKLHPEFENKVNVHLIGNRYEGNTEIPDFVETFCKKYKNVKWLGVVDDETLKAEYSNCTFTVYPSEMEGFGMPIVESLWFGKPCLCNNKGSIGELGSLGGCCLTDVMDETAIMESLHKMINDKDFLLELQHQTTERQITTWDMYADSISEAFSDLSVDFTKYFRKKLTQTVRQTICKYYAEWNGKRVIVVSNYYPPNFIGGAEIIAHNQARQMQKEGLAKLLVVSLDATNRYETGTVYMDEVGDIPVVRVAVQGACFDQTGINFFNKYINDVFDDICSIVNPMVVHCHNIIGTSLGIVDIAKQHNAKVCVTLHDNWGFCFKNTMLNNFGELCTNSLNCSSCMEYLTYGGMRIPIGLRKNYFRRIFERIDAYISPSEYLANSYVKAGFSYHKMNVIWNGIDFEEFKTVEKIPSDKLRITFVGYFGKHKGVDLLIKAVGLLRNEDIEINLVGAGSEQETYKKIATKCSVLHQLRFWGKLANKDIVNAYAETDIYCLPSIWPENQPVSITEAMACGIPVIASNLGGNKELVQDGVTGFLFEAEKVEDLAAKIKFFFDNRGEIENYGAAGKRVISQYDYHKQVKKILTLYDEMSAASGLDSKKILLIKGNILPADIDKLTNYDILLLDWILCTEDLAKTVACLMMPGETLTLNERKKIKENNIKLLVESGDYDKYKAMGFNVEGYSGREELIKKVAMI